MNNLDPKSLLLKLNHWLFKWYYSRVDKHFWQWTFIKSVKLLIQHYDHEQLLHKNANANFRGALNELDATRKDIHNIRMQQIASPGQIDGLNRMFGMDYNNPKDN